MSTNYDMEPLTTPPWWPGIEALVALSADLILYLYSRF